MPPFPVFATEIAPPELGETAWQITVDGLPLSDVVTTTEADAAAAALNGVAHVIAQRGWDACRVTAIRVGDTPEQTQTHPLIVGPQGEVWDLEAAPADAGDKSRRGRVKQKIAIASVAALVLIGGLGAATGVVIARRTSPQAVPAAPAAPAPPQPVELPAQAPALLSSHAVWGTVPVDGTPAILPDGRIATQLDKKLTLLDPTNGHPRELLPSNGTITAGPWVSALGDQSVLAWASADTIHWVTLPDLSAPPRREKLPAGASSLIVGPHGIGWRANATTITVLTPATPLQRTVPADADVVAVVGADVWLSDQLGNSWQARNPSTTAPAPTTFQGPPENRPLGVIAATPSAVVVAWKAEASNDVTYTLHSPGPQLANPVATFPSPRPRVEPGALRTTSRDRAIVESPWIALPGGLLNLDTHALVPLPESAGTLEAVIGNTAWLTRDQSTTAVDLTTGAVTSQRRVERPVRPLAAIPAGILVTARDTNRQGLYALPRL
ncbi:hypothetical protein CGZ93_10430 [Enemella dayhoffiae]|uniref:Uncharacterized protein n=1 Tax=Enemella dayhoffiae TaxID=2016507 RepID=A0A255H1B8_9ACTN|nr:hypothetical protein [Enemella dayhoffiae]OYO21485.1 hypothetical protein CGZ93_10430 [Enemella dayhoffiae]